MSGSVGGFFGEQERVRESVGKCRGIFLGTGTGERKCREVSGDFFLHGVARLRAASLGCRAASLGRRAVNSLEKVSGECRGIFSPWCRAADFQEKVSGSVGGALGSLFL